MEEEELSINTGQPRDVLSGISAIDLEPKSIGQLRPQGEKFEDNLIKAVENSIKAAIYQVPAEHERSNLRRLVDDRDTADALGKKLEVIEYISDECWRPVNIGQENATAYSAIMYLPRTRAMLAIVVGKVRSRISDTAFLETYLADPYAVLRLEPKARLSQYTTDWVDDTEFKRRRAALRDDKRILEERQEEMAEHIQANNLTALFTRIDNVVLERVAKSNEPKRDVEK